MFSLEIIEIPDYPNVTVFNVSVGDRGATWVNVMATCDSVSVFYYVVALQGARMISREEVIENSWAYKADDISHPYNIHYGFRNVFTPGDNISLTVSRLRPASAYNFSGFCQNGNQSVSNTSSVNFTTKTNSGKYLYINFKFQLEVRRDMLLRVACFLAQYMKIPAR